MLQHFYNFSQVSRKVRKRCKRSNAAMQISACFHNCPSIVALICSGLFERASWWSHVSGIFHCLGSVSGRAATVMWPPQSITRLNQAKALSNTPGAACICLLFDKGSLKRTFCQQAALRWTQLCFKIAMNGKVKLLRAGKTQLKRRLERKRANHIKPMQRCSLECNTSTRQLACGPAPQATLTSWPESQRL